MVLIKRPTGALSILYYETGTKRAWAWSRQQAVRQPRRPGLGWADPLRVVQPRRTRLGEQAASSQLRCSGA